MGSKMGKIKLQKIVGNLLIKLRKMYINGTVTHKIFSFPQAIEDSRQFLLLLNRYFTANSRFVPLLCDHFIYYHHQRVL